MKIDPYKHKENYLNWKENCKDKIPNLTKENSDLLLQYLRDMEIGINVAIYNKKGSRSFIRLISIRNKMRFMMRKIEELYNLEDLTKISEEQTLSFFSDMVNGTIVKENGKKYTAVRDYIKIFKAFWHWWQKVNKKQCIEIRDITSDLDCEQSKPDWVYLTEEQVKHLADKAKYEYKILILFLFDTGIRAPTELMNIKVSDFINDFKELNIREETSKTFGRRIKLMLSSVLIKEYVKVQNLSLGDYLFKKHPSIVNQYLKRLAKNVLGDKESPAGQKYSELTMYDFRHCSCCYWLPRYKSESALKYRFGWKKSDKIHYYSELLGMKDTISEEDMLIDITKTEIEKELQKTKKENELLQERLQTVETQLARIMELTKHLEIEVRK
jgi:integrase